MDRVAAKVAQEIGVLLKDDGVDSGACQQKPQHHPGGATPGNAATSLHQAFPLETDYRVG